MTKMKEKAMISIARRTPKRKKELPPLENGDHLDQKTFHERYRAMPPDVRAQLIGGIVYLGSRVTADHGRYQVTLARLLDAYDEATPGVEGYQSITIKMADFAE